LSGFAHPCEHCTDGHTRARRYHDFIDDTLVEDLHLDGRLFRIDERDDISAVDRIPWLDAPL
jgi:hypothetical protein